MEGVRPGDLMNRDRPNAGVMGACDKTPDPSPDEIEAMCAAIQRGWSDATRAARAGLRVGPLELEAIAPVMQHGRVADRPSK